MSKLINLIIIFSIFLGMIMPLSEVKASSNVVLVGVDGLRIRSSMSSSATTIKTLSQGDFFDLVSERPTNSSCSGKWYEIKYDNNKTGFICDTGYREILTATRVRSGPSTSNTQLGLLQPGTRVITTGSASSGNGCAGPWYKITYSGNSNSYICSSTSTTQLVSSSKEAITIVGTAGEFPADYQVQLNVLKQKYPNWEFVPINTGIKFDDFVKDQMVLGKNLININTAWGWVREDTFNFTSGTFRNDFSGGGPRWYAPSEEKVRYNLDPRNFLDERNIFAFENLGYDPIFHTKAGVQSVLNNTFMQGSPNITNFDKNNGKTYADIFMEAAADSGLSPYSLAARVIQEVGRGIPNRNVMVSGTYPGYEGYFNFYNINATGGSDAKTIIENGLQHAKNRDWNSEYAAIKGGATSTLQMYFNRGQNIKYSQKFDFVTGRSLQYMQNLQAAYSEGRGMFNNYRDNDLLNRRIVFQIPVFENMPTSTTRPDSRAGINYLKDLRVDGAKITGFNPEKQTYEITTAKSSVTFSGEAYSLAKGVTGFRTVNLPNANNIHTIRVEAQNGKTRTYTINIKRILDVNLTVNDIITRMDVKADNGHIENIKVGRTLSNFESAVLKEAPAASVSFKDANNRNKTSGRLATGDYITITHGTDSKTFRAVIKGDIVGNGEVTIQDLLRLRRYLLGDINLSEVYLKAADMTGNGEVGLVDLLRIQRILIES